MAAAITTLARLGLGASATESPVTRRLDFHDFDLGITTEFADMNGTRGKYDRDDGRVRANRKRVQPTLRCQPTAVELSYLLPWILDGTPSGTSYPLADTASTLRSLAYDPNGGSLWTLLNVAVDTAKFSCAEGNPLDVSLGLLGRDYAVSGSFPAISLDLTTQPFLMIDCVATIGGTPVQFREFSLEIAKNHDKERYFNSATLTAQNKLRRDVKWSLSSPYGDNASLFATAASAGVAVVATFTNGAVSLSFTSAAVRFEAKSPVSPFQQEVMLPLEGQAYSSDGTTTALATVLDSTP
jgi:hypothetical protein